mmetsp:Transcript_46204/g.131127  ORF Transcript_46204/g.131127 Transcript_46204/m.131127 type:complete len:201 (+) Transcript_46204:879-1481(+)
MMSPRLATKASGGPLFQSATALLKHSNALRYALICVPRKFHWSSTSAYCTSAIAPKRSCGSPLATGVADAVAAQRTCRPPLRELTKAPPAATAAAIAAEPCVDPLPQLPAAPLEGIAAEAVAKPAERARACPAARSSSPARMRKPMWPSMPMVLLPRCAARCAAAPAPAPPAAAAAAPDRSASAATADLWSEPPATAQLM